MDSLWIKVRGTDSLRLWASRTDEVACLTLRTDQTHCEIQMDRAVVEALRDQLPVAMADLGRWAVETVACGEARGVEQRMVDAAARALDLAAAAEQAGDSELAESLRTAAATATTHATAVDAAVTAFEDATVEADHAAGQLIDVMGTAEVTLGRPAANCL